MTNEIIDPGVPQGDSTVDLGSGQLVSMKAVQQIYSEITGRSETLERTYRTNHSVGFDDLRQLNMKLQQLYEQYHIVSKNCSVTLYHVDDQKQTFSSFERFELFDRTTLSPVENIRLEYNFLIVLPQMRKPQSYEIEINIHSRAAIVQKAKADPNFRADMFFTFFSSNTARVEITYVDYTVARNFQVAIHSWFKALPESQTSGILTYLKKKTDYYIFAFRFTSIFAYLAICYSHFGTALAKHPASQTAVFYATVLTFGGMYLLSIVATKLGSIAADTMRQIQCKSHLNLTRGDELAAKALVQANFRSWMRAIGSLALAVAGNILSSLLAIRIGIGP